MTSRLFCFVLSSVISVMLFASGILVLLFFNTNPNIVADLGALPDSSARGGFFGSMLEPFKPQEEVFNVLLLGGDKVNRNTDTIMILNINQEKNQVTLLSIPRDTRAQVGSKVAKINSAYPRGGYKLAMDSISNLLGIDIKYYVYVDVTAFRKIIDALGGVEFYVPDDMDYVDPVQNLYIHLKKGNQLLDGKKAEQFMRFRQYNDHRVTRYYDGSDLKRINAQQKFVKELLRQKTNLLTISKVREVITIVVNNVQTNFTAEKLLQLSENYEMFKLENYDSFMLPGSTNGGGGWYYIKDENKTASIIDKYFATTDE